MLLVRVPCFDDVESVPAVLLKLVTHVGDDGLVRRTLDASCLITVDVCGLANGTIHRHVSIFNAPFSTTLPLSINLIPILHLMNLGDCLIAGRM